MGKIFDFDGPVYKWGTEVADLLILNVLWIVCSLPIFTIGASTTALFYVFGQKVRKEEPYIVKPFFKSFKENFLQGTALTFIVGILWFSSYMYYQIIRSGEAQVFTKLIGLFFIIQVTIMSLYVFPVLSRFHMPLKNIIVTSFILGNKHILSTIICALLFAGCIITVTSLTPFSVVAFSVYVVIVSYIFQRIFTKHIEDTHGDNESNKK